jgi:hypothetical protein
VIEFRKLVADSGQMKLRFRLAGLPDQKDGSRTTTLAISDVELLVPSITSRSPIVEVMSISI